MKYKLIVFDLDGTLVDSRLDLSTGINLTRKHFGLEQLPVEQISSYIGNGVRKLVERSFADAPLVDLDVALAENAKNYSEHLADQTVAYPGVSDLLPLLQERGHLLAVLTNKPGALARSVLEHLGLSSCLSRIVGGGDAPLKPIPDGLLQIIEESGALTSETLMVGDHDTDLAVARLAGVDSAFCHYGIGHQGDELMTHHIINFVELAEFV